MNDSFERAEDRSLVEPEPRQQMTALRDFLVRHRACINAREWVGDKTVVHAWGTCSRADWMLWLLRSILRRDDPRLRLAAADFAERVWHHISDEPSKLAAAWAIGAARRGDPDEMEAARIAVVAAAAVDGLASAAHVAVAAAAPYSAAYYAASYAIAPSYAAAASYVAAEWAAQADILRRHFPAEEISRLVEEASK